MEIKWIQRKEEIMKDLAKQFHALPGVDAGLFRFDTSKVFPVQDSVFIFSGHDVERASQGLGKIFKEIGFVRYKDLLKYVSCPFIVYDKDKKLYRFPLNDSYNFVLGQEHLKEIINQLGRGKEFLSKEQGFPIYKGEGINVLGLESEVWGGPETGVRILTRYDNIPNLVEELSKLKAGESKGDFLFSLSERLKTPFILTDGKRNKAYVISTWGKEGSRLGLVLPYISTLSLARGLE